MIDTYCDEMTANFFKIVTGEYTDLPKKEGLDGKDNEKFYSFFKKILINEVNNKGYNSKLYDIVSSFKDPKTKFTTFTNDTIWKILENKESFAPVKAAIEKDEKLVKELENIKMMEISDNLKDYVLDLSMDIKRDSINDINKCYTAAVNNIEETSINHLMTGTIVNKISMELLNKGWSKKDLKDYIETHDRFEQFYRKIQFNLPEKNEFDKKIIQNDLLKMVEKEAFDLIVKGESVESLAKTFIDGFTKKFSQQQLVEQLKSKIDKVEDKFTKNVFGKILNKIDYYITHPNEKKEEKVQEKPKEEVKPEVKPKEETKPNYNFTTGINSYGAPIVEKPKEKIHPLNFITKVDASGTPIAKINEETREEIPIPQVLNGLGLLNDNSKILSEFPIIDNLYNALINIGFDMEIKNLNGTLKIIPTFNKFPIGVYLIVDVFGGFYNKVPKVIIPIPNQPYEKGYFIDIYDTETIVHYLMGTLNEEGLQQKNIIPPAWKMLNDRIGIVTIPDDIKNDMITFILKDEFQKAIFECFQRDNNVRFIITENNFKDINNFVLLSSPALTNATINQSITVTDGKISIEPELEVETVPEEINNKEEKEKVEKVKTEENKQEEVKPKEENKQQDQKPDDTKGNNNGTRNNKRK